MNTVYDAALHWINQGRRLIPLQPGSKRIIGGFGPYGRQITEKGEAAAWFRDRRCNLAVVLGGGLLCLDFDHESDYTTWAAAWPVCAQTLTERTRRGYHVFLAGESLSGRRPGYEILGPGRVVTVSPSIVGGIVYQVTNPAAIVAVPIDFPLLSESPKIMPLLHHGGSDVLTRIKAAFPVTDVMTEAGVKLSGSGRWRRGRCPFHGDNNPSLWVDTERGLWGCRACGAHGDVVNLWAMVHGVGIQEAIKAMAAAL